MVRQVSGPGPPGRVKLSSAAVFTSASTNASSIEWCSRLLHRYFRADRTDDPVVLQKPNYWIAAERAEETAVSENAA
jgi:hypothetical protein